MKKNGEVTVSLKNLSEQTNIHFSIILKSTFELEGETPIRTGITFYWIRHAFEVDRNSLETKKKYVFYQTTIYFAEKLDLVFGFMKGKQMDKSKLAKEFAEIIIIVALTYKCLSNC